MAAKRSVLLIDGNALSMEGYVRELEGAKFKVTRCYDAACALDYLNTNQPVSAVVLDIALPAGDRFKGVDTMHGLTTGLHLFRELKSSRPELPLLFLTSMSKNLALTELLEDFKEVTEGIILEKLQCPPEELTKKVQATLASGPTPPSQAA